MITPLPNPKSITLFYEQGGEEKAFTIPNNHTEEDPSFHIVYNTLLKKGGEYCVKQWIGINCNYVDIMLDIQVEKRIISI